MNTKFLKHLRCGTALLMCFLLSPLCPAAFGSDGLGGEPAGRVTGISSSASLRGQAASLKDLVRTNDLLSTNRSGRLRLRLEDGSILSIGSQSQVKVSKHEASTGETLINLTSGRLRSRVVRVRKSGSRFQVITPQARISVVGTDFFLDVGPERTQVVVYSGIVLVGANSGGSPVDVAAGQTTTVDRNGISRLILTAEDYEQETIAETALPDEVAPPSSTNTQAAEKKPSHLRRNLLIGAAVAGGALAAGLAARGGSNSQSQPAPASASTIPSIPPH